MMDTLLDRLRSEAQPPPTVGRLCQGTLLSKVQYAIDIDRWGYEDARRLPLKEKAGRSSGSITMEALIGKEDSWF